MVALSRLSDSGKLPGGSPANPGSLGTLRALGHFRILRSLGSGGMSEVYLAYDEQKSCQVAIKVLADRLMSNQSFVNRFLQEGRLGKELSHPNIVKTHEFGRDPVSGKYFIAMEHVDGLTAHDRLERDGKLPVAEAVRLIIDIGRGLEHLHHQGYVHRDIKPGNILIAPDGSGKLIDLGVAKRLENSTVLTSLDQSVGTPYYMPWEQGVNSNLVDARSDVFALGATFYHLLTGQVPFPGEDEATIAKQKVIGEYAPVIAVNRNLPRVLDTILERMMARDPRKRFASALEVVEVLNASGLTSGTFSSDMDILAWSPQPLAPTRADLKSQAELETPLEAGAEQVWLVKFQRPEDGLWRKLRGRTPEIARLYREGELPEEVFAAREHSKVYRRLKVYPEYRNVSRRLMVSVGEPSESALREAADEPAPSAWEPYLHSLVFAGIIASALCFAVVALMRLLELLN